MKKHYKSILKFSFMFSMIVLFFGAWSIHWQESTNKQFFWETSRVISGIGFMFAVISWIFWEVFTSSSKQKLLYFVIALILLVIAVIMINGIMGIIGGIFAIMTMTLTFFLDYYNIVTIKNQVS